MKELLKSLEIGTPVRLSLNGKLFKQCLYLGPGVVQGKDAYLFSDGTPFGFAMTEEFMKEHKVKISLTDNETTEVVALLDQLKDQGL